MALLKRWKLRVARRLSSSAHCCRTGFPLRATLLLALMCAGGFLLSNVLHRWMDHQPAGGRQAAAAAAYAPLLTGPLRTGDRVQAGKVLLAMVKDPALDGARLLGADGKSIAAAGADVRSAPASLLQEIPIADAAGDTDSPLGRLVTRGAGADGSLRRHALLSALVMAGLFGGLLICLGLAYRSTIGLPLRSIERALSFALRAGKPVRIRWNGAGSMGRLIDAFNTLVDREWEHRQALVRAYGSLEEKVLERTSELTAALEREKAAGVQITRMAEEDDLTRLPNRRCFTERLEAALKGAGRRRTKIAVMVLDLDRFKNVNDTLGHAAGDMLLKVVANRLKSATRAEEIVARLGGDEFAILLRDGVEPLQLVGCAERFLAQLNKPVTVNNNVVYPGGSIGISVWPSDADSAPMLLANADTALYKAKEAGRGRFMFFDEEMRAQIRRSDRVEAELREALVNDELKLFYQPKIDLRSGEPVGFEALVRWTRPHGVTISPAEWLGVAEDRGLIIPVSECIIRRAVGDFGQWWKLGLDPGSVAINIHPVQMQTLDHIEHLIEMMAASNVPLDRFVLEITEGCVVGRHSDTAMTVLMRMRHKGISLSLDDFGTGYASLTHLKELPVDEIKIDGSFTRGIGKDPGDEAIIQAIVQLAQKMGLRIVAEGIETPEQYRFLRDCGCTAGQGFLLSKPLSFDHTTAFLESISRRERPRPARAEAPPLRVVHSR